jgi:hypothetical protein
MDEWTSEEGVSYEIWKDSIENKVTSITDDNQWWNIIKNVLQTL